MSKIASGNAVSGPKWDLRPLRCDIERCFGREAVQQLNPVLNSIGDRRGFAQFHFTEARRLMSEQLVDRKEFEIVGALLGAYDAEPGDFSWARFRAAAHVSACVQSMHSLADIVGHLIYYVLGMPADSSTRLVERDISLRAVRRKLASGPVRDLIGKWLDDPGFAYLTALVNHSKHRSIVSVGYSVDFTESPSVPHGLKFGAFEFDGVHYHERWVHPTLVTEYQRQETLLHEIGPLLNGDIARRP